MVHKFTLENFYSFKEKNTVDFTVNNNAPKSDSYIEDSFEIRLTKLIAAFGANASGKTNLLKVLPFIGWLITYSYSLKPEEEIPVQPYLFLSNINNPIKLSVDFEIDKKIYHYDVELNKKLILFEQLTVKETKKFRKLFSRRWSGKDKGYILDIKNYKLDISFKSFIRNNSSLISTAKQANHALSNIITQYWNRLYFNVVEVGREQDNDLFEAGNFFHTYPKLKEKAEKLLKKYDLGLEGFDIKEINTEKNKKIYAPYGIHIKNSNYRLEFIRESGGTQNLFILLSKILPALEEGGVVILDEFDNDLHPQMIPELMELFISPVYNSKNAQILFSTHHPEILQRLDKYQVIFVEKDKNGSSTTYRMDAIRGVRSDDNYYAKYISGAYGAIPNL